jgi:Leucine-rich repeat (LRR) protein
MVEKPEPTVIIVSTDTSSGKPLDFSFKELQTLDQLLSTEQRQGIRLPIKSAEEMEEEKKEVTNLTAASGLVQKEEAPKVDIEENEDDTHRKKRQEEVLKGPPPPAIAKILADNVTSANATRASGHGDQGQSVIRKKLILKHTTCLILSYNYLESLNGLMDTLPKIMKNPLNLGWIDLSFNLIKSLTPELGALPNLKSLYLHCNYLLSLDEVAKLRNIELLAVTLHGNPIERLPGYRLQCIAVLPPSVKKLDSALITALERDNTDHKASRSRRLPKITDPNLLHQFEEEIKVKKDRIKTI